MRLRNLEINGFKSFAQKTNLEFQSPIVSIVGPNGSGKSNVVEALRFVLGEQSMKSMRGKAGSDLIFKGSKNLSKGSRASVTIYFNNSDKIFKLSNDGGEDINLNFDTISISREVYQDGLSKYVLNGSEVRLKDIHNLLASVNIGSSSHHIISQGEADRILNANAKDLREMIEDALGLKIYQYKIKDSERKLERTEENMKEVGMLRRENAPHLKFLEKQVEKFEKAKEMKMELLGLYQVYLKKESVYLEREKATLFHEKKRISRELEEVRDIIKNLEGETSVSGNKKIEELRAIEQKINEIRLAKGEMERKLGRIEGMLEAKQNRVRVGGKCPMCGTDIREKDPAQLELVQHDEREIEELKTSKVQILDELDNSGREEKTLFLSAEKLRRDINEEMESLREEERKKFSHKVKHQELSSALELVAVKESNLAREVEAFENEIREGAALVGHSILSYKDFEWSEIPDRHAQEEEKKKLERIKIKLEDAGAGSGAEVMKEFQEVSERDKFLEKELEDLARSIESLEALITELKDKIDIKFKEGVKEINTEFNQFFMLMFGGGHASLSIVVENKKKKLREDVEEDEEDAMEKESEIVFEQGIEINVSLPQKKVKELHALSGGERSLTSIALLFAMSQVNPPPFLVLDETDAALDEANSRKYGDMLEKLSKHSQLIVVTHNRETMSRAGMLYGVTIGGDGASKLLSVRFDEAVAIAK